MRLKYLMNEKQSAHKDSGGVVDGVLWELVMVLAWFSSQLERGLNSKHSYFVTALKLLCRSVPY